jgi:hypothetical protein
VVFDIHIYAIAGNKSPLRSNFRVCYTLRVCKNPVGYLHAFVCAMRNQAKNFLSAVRGEKPAPCLSAEAVKDLQIAADYITMTGETGQEAVPYNERNLKFE